MTEHIAGCSRCQQILLLLEATDEIPLPVAAEDDLKIGESVLSTGALYVDYSAIQTPSLTVAGQATPASKAPQDISRGRGFKALRWAAPAGAIAAGLLIWFVVRDNKVQTLSHFENVQVAQQQSTEERPPTPRALPASPASPAPEPATKITQLDEKRKDEGRLNQAAKESAAPLASNSSSSAAIADEARSRANTRRLSTDSNYGAQSADTGKEPEISSRQAGVSAAAAAPTPAISGDTRAESAAPIATPLAVSDGVLAKPANEQADHTNTTTTTGLAVPPAEQMATKDKLELSRSLNRDRFENTKVILAPSGTVLWRLLPEGRIEHSVDAGSTWAPQNSGVKIELLAGSAPSETVCWVVGRGGTILRTTDGGGHWNKVVSPMPTDVTGVQGVDAMTGEIFGANKSSRFVTHDGGVTWQAEHE